MATLYGVNKTKSLASPQQLIDTPDAGHVRVAYDEYTSTGIIGATDVIKLMTIPAGAKIINAKIVWTDLGTTGAAVIGFASNTDALAPSCDFTSAGQYISDSAIATNVALLSKLTEDTEVLISMSAATTAAGTIKVLVEYAFV